MARTLPKLIPEEWMPSQAVYRWAEQMHITVQKLHECRHEFVLWHTEKGVKRANFNLAFRNWLKKELEIDAKQIKPAAFKEFQPEKNIKVASKETANHYLDKIKRGER